jgi:hypothetical protein
MSEAVAPAGNVQALIFFDIRSIDKRAQLGGVLQRLWDVTKDAATRPVGSAHGPASFEDNATARSTYYHWATFADAKAADGFLKRSHEVLKQEGLPAVSVVTEPGQALPGRGIRGTFHWIAQQKKAPGFIP